MTTIRRDTPDLRKHRKKMFAIYNICYYCGKWLNPEDKTIEHIIPLSEKGTHNRINLAVVHTKCNNMIRDLGAKNFLLCLHITKERRKLLFQRIEWLTEFYKEYYSILGEIK
jgi:hypothetical protein